MKLRTKLFPITNLKGEEINVDGKPIVLSLNGELMETKLEDVFTDLEFDDGEIYGNSLLSYYKVNEDGSLEVEGSKVQLFDSSSNEPVLVKQIKRPGINADTDIPFEHVKKFAEYFKIAKPEEVFKDLNDSEKQIFVSERDSIKELHTKAIVEKAEEDRISAETAERELKASIDPIYVQEKKHYLTTQSFYAGMEGFKEYIKDKYHLFYGDDPEQAPCVLIKRGDAWWEECREDDTEIMEKTDSLVIIEFNDGQIHKKLTLDRAAGQIAIINAEAAA